VTETHAAEGCTCPPTRDLIARAFTGAEIPTCPTHRPASVTPTALNDDAALAAKLGAPLTKGA
jgi:hypothetical protein